MPMTTTNAAEPRTFRDRFGDTTLRVSVVAWLLSYFAARWALNEFATAGTAIRLAIALVPLVPFVVFLLGFIAHLRRTDELERRVQLEALAVAFPLTVVLLMLLALVQLAMPLNPDDWSYRHVWSFLPMFWLVGAVIARRRYS